MASNQQQYAEQLQLLEQRYPQVSTQDLLYFLQQHNGDIDKVCAHLIEEERHVKKLDSLESRFGTALTALQKEYPASESIKRTRLLRILDRFDGDIEHVRKFLQKHETKHNESNVDSNVVQRQQQEEIKIKYATQLAELRTAGINIHSPCILLQLEKCHGDVNKILETTKCREEKKHHITELDTKYSSQIVQLEMDGIKIKNKRLLLELLEKANGQVDIVKQLLAERDKQKHQSKSSINTNVENHKKLSSSKKQHEIDIDDIDNLKQLRSAGIHGNPMKILALFHECNQSIEMTKARIEKDREQHEQQYEKRTQQRITLAEIHDAYLTINNRNDWPDNIQQVYLDGNNMMFVIDSIRRLCLNRASKKAERAIAELAAAWNEQMHIPNVELIFDLTHQLEQIQSIKVSSAQPMYKTTDDMLIDIVRRSENKEKNRHTIIITSDRDLAIHLKREECQLVKPHQWFSHCAMILTPDLIKHEEITEMSTIATTKNKSQYDLNELVRRIVKIDL
ncbi:unnamed protein product [Rotaria sp. Silwood2]|nr:unnamed protein product [Rotaria sp. Silwood2]CAF2978862.1 unnamed protein product [Rotaria sp. Silwood2]CAF4424186.1 unnamed protein product [Rotaria sp. Silwood2]